MREMYHFDLVKQYSLIFSRFSYFLQKYIKITNVKIKFDACN